MPINYQEIYTQIKKIGAGAKARRKKKEDAQAQARDLLAYFDSKLDELRSKVDSAKAIDQNIRCALPLNEPLASSYPKPDSVVQATLIAADGSQIVPDRHAAIQFGLINVGGIVLKPESGQTPNIFTDSRLFFDHELYTDTGSITQEAIEFRRDIAEREKLLALAKEHTGTVITLTDGPVEIWGAKNAGEGDYQKTLEQHKSVLSQLQDRDVIVGGYVDKPGADLVTRLLELTQLTDEQIKEVRRQHPLRGVSDRWLFGKVLNSGERSAVFAIQSSSRTRYTGSLSLHFFYLNVGDKKHPYIVRVEIPKWVADNKDKLEILHYSLIEQCAIMGVKPYPYILHRAHEIAVVSFDEKKQIEQMIEAEELRNGGEVDEISGKQSAKDRQGRTRIK